MFRLHRYLRGMVATKKVENEVYDIVKRLFLRQLWFTIAVLSVLYILSTQGITERLSSLVVRILTSIQ